MLEQVVRPWVAPGAIVANNVVSIRTKVNRERARVVWGTVGTLPTPDKADGTDPGSYKFKLEACDDTYKESTRSATKIRVENPNDSSQYVMVDRINSIAFAHQSDAKILSAFSTQTTGFSDTTITDDAIFGSVPKSEACKATYTLTNP